VEEGGPLVGGEGGVVLKPFPLGIWKKGTKGAHKGGVGTGSRLQKPRVCFGGWNDKGFIWDMKGWTANLVIVLQTQLTTRVVFVKTGGGFLSNS